MISIFHSNQPYIANQNSVKYVFICCNLDLNFLRDVTRKKYMEIFIMNYLCTIPVIAYNNLFKFLFKNNGLRTLKLCGFDEKYREKLQLGLVFKNVNVTLNDKKLKLHRRYEREILCYLWAIRTYRIPREIKKKIVYYAIKHKLRI